MSFSIIPEVWEHEPEDLSLVSHSVLMTIADSAAVDSRMTCLGIDELARRSKVSRRSAFNALKDLHARGILQNVAEDSRPEEHRRYRSETRRITEVHHWAEGRPVPEYTKPRMGAPGALENTAAEFGSAPGAPNPFSSSTKKREKKTSSSSESPPALRGKKSARAISKAEDDYDPAKALWSDDELGIEPPAQTSGRRAPGPDTGMGLAAYFVDAVSRTGAWRGLDIANQQKLAGTLNRWKRQGTTPEYIRHMIDVYVSDEGLRNTRAVPWTDFLAKRAVLHAKAEARDKAKFWDRYFADEVPEEPQQPRKPDPIWG